MWWRKRRKPVAALREELTCPGCGYSLRGLAGDVATCPECGMRCDLAKLVMRSWIGPWYEAPGFGRILFPLVWPGFGWWVLLLVWTVEVHAYGRLPVFTVLLAALLAAGWVWSMWRLRRQMPGGAAILLALFAHAILLGHLVALLAVIVFVVQAAFAGSLRHAAPMLAGAAVSIGLIWLCRRGQRFIAERCIRRHLIDAAAT